jgi:hypothetical protein
MAVSSVAMMVLYTVVEIAMVAGCIVSSVSWMLTLMSRFIFWK